MATRAVMLILLAAACAKRPPNSPSTLPDSSTSTRITRERVAIDRPGASSGRVADFVAAVPAISTGGECQTIPIDRGSRLVLLSFPARAHAERNVSLRLDAAGTLLNYSDVRGDLRRREQRTGAVTSVVITFDQGVGTASNEWPDRPIQLVFGTPAEILAAENLGRPSEMVKEVIARCAPPSPA